MIESTHDITLDDERVVKRYRSWEKGEPDREWNGLVLLDRCAPGLAPRPLERSTQGGAPVVVMSRLAGRSLGEGRLRRDELQALGRALRELHCAVPVEQLRDVPERHWGPRELISTVRPWANEPHPPVSAHVESALDAARGWLTTPAVTELEGPLVERVFAIADGNLGNFIWDGERCRVVDLEDSGVSDPAYEVADLVEHVTVTLHDLVDVDELVAGLRFTPEQAARLLSFRRLFAVFWLLMLLPGNPAHARNPEGSVERQAARVQRLLGAAPLT